MDDSSPISSSSSAGRKALSRRSFLVGTSLAGLAVAGGAGWLAAQRFSSHAITSPTRSARPFPSEIMNWHENQIIITAHSDLHHSEGMQKICQALDLEQLRQFLGTHGYSIAPFGLNEISSSLLLSPSIHANDSHDMNNPLGKWLFPSPSGQGTLLSAGYRVWKTNSSQVRTAQQDADGQADLTGEVVQLLNSNQ